MIFRRVSLLQIFSCVELFNFRNPLCEISIVYQACTGVKLVYTIKTSYHVSQTQKRMPGPYSYDHYKTFIPTNLHEKSFQ